MIEFLYYLPKQSNWFVQFITALKDPDCGNLSHFAKLLDPEGEHFAFYVLPCQQKNSICIGQWHVELMLSLFNCITSFCLFGIFLLT